jgi:hypothetical protein
MPTLSISGGKMLPLVSVVVTSFDYAEFIGSTPVAKDRDRLDGTTAPSKQCVKAAAPLPKKAEKAA